MDTTVKQLAAYIPVTDEMIVDHRIGTPEQQHAAAVRWKAYGPRRRIDHAVAAIRGEECEGRW